MRGCQPDLGSVDDVPCDALAFVEQRCPTCPEEVQARYRRHNQYERCVLAATQILLQRGDLTGAQKARIDAAAARSPVCHDDDH